jgi:hypothetical protein
MMMPLGTDIQMSGISSAVSGVSRAAMGGDAFGQLILQLIGGMGEDGLAKAMESLLWLPTNEDGQNGKKSGLTEMLVAMMGIVPGQLDFRQFASMDAGGWAEVESGAIQEIGNLSAEKLSAWVEILGANGASGANGAIGQEIRGPDMEATESEINALWQQAMQKPPDVGETGADSAKAWGHEPLAMLPEGFETTPIRVLGYQTANRGGNEDAFLGQEHFRQAVQEAKTKLSGKESRTDDSVSTVMQGESAFRTLASSYRVRDAAPAEELGIPGQVFLGLSQNLKAGKGEFVIKLVPEGLGEITVKLLEKEGRTTLRIVTASAETAKLINQDLAALQNALKPIRVEVREAVPEAQESKEEAAYFAGFDQFDQFNQFNQYSNQSGSRDAPGISQANRISGELESDPAMLAGAALPDSDLDMYI